MEKQVVLERYSDNELWVVSDTPARQDEMLTLDRVGSSPPLSMPVRVASTDVVMRDGVPYHELGPAYLDERQRERAIHRHVRQLEQLGYHVMLVEPPAEPRAAIF